MFNIFPGDTFEEYQGRSKLSNISENMLNKGGVISTRDVSNISNRGKMGLASAEHTWCASLVCKLCFQ